MVPAGLKYSRDHEWVKETGGDEVMVGVTDYAQEALGEVVFVELPQEGDTFEAGESMGVLESVKAASDIYAPLSGTIIAINEELLEHPELVNQDPYGGGWLVTVRFDKYIETEGLLSAADYKAFLDGGEGEG